MINNLYIDLNVVLRFSNGKCSREIENRKSNSMPSTTGMHLVMTTQCAVKDSWSGRQVWWCPSTQNTKLLWWQNLAAKQAMYTSHGHQTTLRSRGDDIGVCALLALQKIGVQKQTSRLRQRHRVETDSIILWQVHVGHDDKDKECRPCNSPQYLQNKSHFLRAQTWFI